MFALPLAGNAQKPTILSFDAPGADTNSGDYNGTIPQAINIWGTIAGYYNDATNVSHGFVRTKEGKFTTFEAPGADTTPNSYNGTIVFGMNDAGAMTGTYYDVSGAGHGFIRSPGGKFTSFDPPGAVYLTYPISINLLGAVAGYYIDVQLSVHGFVRSADGNISTVDGPGACQTGISNGCYGTGLSNVNAWGLSVGRYMDSSLIDHGFIRTAQGKLIVFDAPGAGTDPNAVYPGTFCPGCFDGLNQWGAVAGTYTDNNDVSHGFVRSPTGEITTFDAPGAGISAYQGTGCVADCPVSLNDWGMITGTYADSNFVNHGYVRSAAGKFTSFDPGASIFTLPTGINDTGTVIGYYVDANNVYHGFLRNPD